MKCQVSAGGDFRFHSAAAVINMQPTVGGNVGFRGAGAVIDKHPAAVQGCAGGVDVLFVRIAGRPAGFVIDGKSGIAQANAGAGGDDAAGFAQNDHLAVVGKPRIAGDPAVVDLQGSHSFNGNPGRDGAAAHEQLRIGFDQSAGNDGTFRTRQPGAGIQFDIVQFSRRRGTPAGKHMQSADHRAPAGT